MTLLIKIQISSIYFNALMVHIIVPLLIVVHLQKMLRRF
nr:MAG TPA_asm: hypothetical protein [Bacteriophage sp.]